MDNTVAVQALLAHNYLIHHTGGLPHYSFLPSRNQLEGPSTFKVCCAGRAIHHPALYPEMFPAHRHLGSVRQVPPAREEPHHRYIVGDTSGLHPADVRLLRALSSLAEILPQLLKGQVPRPCLKSFTPSCKPARASGQFSSSIAALIPWYSSQPSSTDCPWLVMMYPSIVVFAACDTVVRSRRAS